MARGEFVSIDVETANADMASICQIGVAHFVDGALAHEWETLVDPQDEFDGINVSIHGIDENTVLGAPTFLEAAPNLGRLLGGRVVVCHTHFDRVAVHRAATRHGITPPDCTWLDSARVARRAWAEFATKGYGLANLCKKIGYEFEHHDALEDAKAAGHVLLAAIAHSGVGLEDWINQVELPIDPNREGPGSSITRRGKRDGPLFGEVIVFTGALDIPRRDAADMAAEIGCKVGQGITSKTTLLVVGDQDIRILAGHNKSSKHRKAEALILEGQPIRILSESDFKELVRTAD